MTVTPMIEVRRAGRFVANFYASNLPQFGVKEALIMAMNANSVEARLIRRGTVAALPDLWIVAARRADHTTAAIYDLRPYDFEPRAA